MSKTNDDKTMMRFADGTVKSVGIGDVLYEVSNQRGNAGKEVTVTKLGRVYITCGRTQFSMANGKEKSDICPSDLYPSKEDYESLKALKIKNYKFQEAIKRGTRWSNEQIDQVVKILELSLDK